MAARYEVLFRDTLCVLELFHRNLEYRNIFVEPNWVASGPNSAGPVRWMWNPGSASTTSAESYLAYGLFLGHVGRARLTATCHSDGASLGGLFVRQSRDENLRRYPRVTRNANPRDPYSACHGPVLPRPKPRPPQPKRTILPLVALTELASARRGKDQLAVPIRGRRLTRHSTHF
ncbi:hypothetical protein ACIRRA_41390 [Nocardia sp. NPDC101769]|uniref:hypothetical protein n=1 Tax=Nocardia sp. NPDC101769 TaxID=3364333 RepID=UPI0037F4C2E7